jgi:ornithine cyclodeaminase
MENAVLLNVSLRDVSANIILQADNTVDDIDQVCSNQTSIHLAQQQVGHNAFIRTTIGNILNGDAIFRDTEKPFAIYSPFGLGILDIAVAHLTQRLALAQKVGTTIEAFLPKPWLER